MSRNNRKQKSITCIEAQAVQHIAEDDFWEYEAVGDKVVNPYLILSLLEGLDGKVVPDDYEFSMPELCGREYYEKFSKSARAAMGQYLAMLINDGRLKVDMVIKVAWTSWPVGSLS